ncbi:MAG TPA: winged helix-turn-helix domain-containing protein [Polyangia bacterium]|nr:winged helix-turn-helix domain-containing protein [Polyangia bacterium]
MMLDGLFGNATAAKVLTFVAANRECYAQELADRFDVSLSSVQNQLKRLADGGVLVGVERGRTRLYSFNPRFPLARELESMLRRALELYPERERERYTARRRPRARGKRL